MRHGKKFNHLGRKTAHRKAMLSNMACSLIEHKQINTTLAKAKALRTYLEPIITKSKDDTTHSRRTVFKYLQSKDAVTELFREVAPKVAERPGGYTRIIKLGHRLGDAAEMALIELVDFNDIYESGKPKKKSTRRRRRGGSKNEDSAPKAAAQEEALVEDAVVVEDTPAEENEDAPKAEIKREEAPKADENKAEKKDEGKSE